jgi:hypothetical protein
VLLALFDVATLGTIVQAPLHPAAPYVAFFTALLFLIGVALLPAARAGRSLRVTVVPGLNSID